MTELTTHEEYALMMGDCPQCGVIQGEDWSEEQCAEALQIDADLEKQSPGFYVMLNKLKPMVLCDACFAVRESAPSEKLREIHISAVWRNTYGSELMPKSSKHQTFADSTPEIEERNTDAWTWARGWKPVSGNAWIFGLEGRGKTFWARCIAMAQLQKGFTVAEIGAIEWCAKSGDFKWQERRDRLARVHLLIFEDIDKSNWTRHSFEKFWDLINVRYENERRTIITSNSRPEFMIGKASGNISGVWPQIQGNSSMTHTLAARLKPCKRWELTGESLRRSEG